jgi:hypothetical protein
VIYLNQTQTYQLHVSACDKSIIKLLIRITKKLRTLIHSSTESRVGHGYLSLVNIVCCQVEVSATGNECGQSVCDREALIMRRSWSTRGCSAAGVIYANENLNLLH